MSQQFCPQASFFFFFKDLKKGLWRHLPFPSEKQALLHHLQRNLRNSVTLKKKPQIHRGKKAQEGASRVFQRELGEHPGWAAQGQLCPSSTHGARAMRQGPCPRPTGGCPSPGGVGVPVSRSRPGAPRVAPPPRSNVARARPPPPPIGRRPRQSRLRWRPRAGRGGRAGAAAARAGAARRERRGRAGARAARPEGEKRSGRGRGGGARYLYPRVFAAAPPAVGTPRPDLPPGWDRFPPRAPQPFSWPPWLPARLTHLGTAGAGSPPRRRGTRSAREGRGEPGWLRPPTRPAPLASPRRGRVPGPGRARRRRQRRLPPSRPWPPSY